MYSWGRLLSYVVAALVGLLIGGSAGRWLGAIMHQRRILETGDSEYWRDVLAVVFACAGIGGGLYVVGLILTE